MAEEKRMKVKKGCLAVRVGLEDGEEGFKRFIIPISYLYRPMFKQLLEKAREVYGFHSSGPLKLPCSADEFQHLCWLIEHESRGAHGHHGNHYHRVSSLPFNAC